LPKDDNRNENRDMNDHNNHDHDHDNHDTDECDINDRTDTQVFLTHMKELKEIQTLIDKLNLKNPFTADKFIKYVGNEIITEMISNEEILKIILSNNNQEEEAEEIPLPVITYSETIEFYDKVILYLEQQEDTLNTKKEELKFVKKLKKEVQKQRFISARQTNLDSYVNIIE